jgi:hypothetical protein
MPPHTETAKDPKHGRGTPTPVKTVGPRPGAVTHSPPAKRYTLPTRSPYSRRR